MAFMTRFGRIYEPGDPMPTGTTETVNWLQQRHHRPPAGAFDNADAAQPFALSQPVGPDAANDPADVGKVQGFLRAAKFLPNERPASGKYDDATFRFGQSGGREFLRNALDRTMTERSRNGDFGPYQPQQIHPEVSDMEANGHLDDALRSGYGESFRDHLGDRRGEKTSVPQTGKDQEAARNNYFRGRNAGISAGGPHRRSR